MRDIRIDFAGNELFPDGNIVGKTGEHLATQLVVALPDRLVDGIDYHIACFSVGGVPVSSSAITESSTPAHRDGNTLYIPLWQTVTASTELLLTVEAYIGSGDDVECIAKTPRVSLRLTESVPEVDPGSTEGQGMAADVVALKVISHEHDNKDVIDLIGVNDSGAMTFNGETFGGDNSGKADKVANATSGNFAALNASGNLADSGKKPADFVATEVGKVLSTNDFTTPLKNKLDGVEAGAEVNVLESIKLHGAAKAITDKAVELDDAVDSTTFSGQSSGTFMFAADKSYYLQLTESATFNFPAPTSYLKSVVLIIDCSVDVDIAFPDGSTWTVDVGTISSSAGCHTLVALTNPSKSAWEVRELEAVS